MSAVLQAKEAREITALTLLAVAVMALTEGLFSSYWAKAGVKLAVFLLPAGLCAVRRRLPLAELFRPRRRDLRTLALGLAAVCAILGLYFLLRNTVDFSGVTASLSGGAGVTRENFLPVAVYIILVNATLEEFFFRGFAYLTLRRFTGGRFASCFSAGVFALYHAAILRGWFHPLLFAALLLALFAVGLLFNALDRRGSIVPAYLVHACANLAINLIGCLLFGIL